MVSARKSEVLEAEVLRRRRRARLHEAALVCEHDRLCAVVQIELAAAGRLSPFQSLADRVDETYFFPENYALDGDTRRESCRLTPLTCGETPAQAWGGGQAAGSHVFAAQVIGFASCR
jgi:hypothetical protein